jgi:ATP-binding cassette, subfamily B, bacterial CvaB/MchF/RaxB
MRAAESMRRRLPVTLQTEVTECGLASIAMVAAYWGNATGLAELRKRFAPSLKGSSLKSLIDLARQLGLHCRPVKLDLVHLRDLKLPCILHWDMNHFVVLTAVDRERVVIHDPAIGRRRLPLSETSKHFTGVALELVPGDAFVASPAPPRVTVLSLVGRLSGLRRGLAQGLLLAATLQACALVAPFYLQWIVDGALARGDRPLIMVLGVGFLLLAGARALFSALRSWAMTVLATNLNFQWLINTFSHLLKLPLAYFEKRHLGDIVSRFNSIQLIQRSLTTQFIEAIVDGLLAAVTLVVMWLYSASLAGVACAATACYLLLRFAVFRSLRDATAEQIVHAARQQTHLLESARGVATLRLFDRTEERRIGWTNRLADQFNAELRVARLSISFQTARLLLTGAERVIVIWLAALAVLDGRLSVGMMLAFIGYKDSFSESVSALIDKLFELRMLGLHAERVADIVLTPVELETPHDAIDLAHVGPSLELRGLGFRYAEGEPFVFKDLDLSVPAGQCIAITGASGCGKTTLVKLLLGLLVPTEGQILVGGIPLHQLGWTNYRRLAAAVMQDDLLFAGSIADNISFFDPQANQERIEACAQQAAIDREIRAMPMGYTTLVGEGGGSLSGGQRQRILLARALYKRPKLLVLDEATSHLDLVNEQRVNEAIRRCQLTRLLVAHRPETIAMADRVVVLADGRIVRDLRQASLAPTAAVLR